MMMDVVEGFKKLESGDLYLNFDNRQAIERMFDFLLEQAERDVDVYFIEHTLLKLLTERSKNRLVVIREMLRNNGE